MVWGEFLGFPFCSHISCTGPAGASIQNCQQVPTTTTIKPENKLKQNKTKTTFEKSLFLLTKGLEEGPIWPISRKPFWPYSHLSPHTHSNTNGNYVLSLHSSTNRPQAPIPHLIVLVGVKQEADLSLPILWNQVCTDSQIPLLGFPSRI